MRKLRILEGFAILFLVFAIFVATSKFFSATTQQEKSAVKYSEIANKYEKIVFPIRYSLKVKTLNEEGKEETEENKVIETGFFTKINDNVHFVVFPSHLETGALTLSEEKREKYLSKENVSIESLPYDAEIIFSDEKTGKAEFVGVNTELRYLVFKLLEEKKYEFDTISLDTYIPSLGDEFYVMGREYTPTLGISKIIIYPSYIMGIDKNNSYFLSYNGGIVFVDKKLGRIAGIIGLAELQDKETDSVILSMDRLITQENFSKLINSEVKKVELNKAEEPKQEGK